MEDESPTLNHLITLEVSFHWLIHFCCQLYLWLIFSKIALLIFPILDFEAFIKRQKILFRTSPLWSFIVIYTSVSCTISILSDIGSFSTIFLVWLFTLFTLFTFRRLEFLYFFVVFSCSSFFYFHFDLVCIRVKVSTVFITLTLGWLVNLFSFYSLR